MSSHVRPFSEKQLEGLFNIYSERELSQPVREAVRMHVNNAWSVSSAARKHKVRRQTVSDALARLEATHKIIMKAYANMIID